MSTIENRYLQTTDKVYNSSSQKDSIIVNGEVVTYEACWSFNGLIFNGQKFDSQEIFYFIFFFIFY